MSGKSSISISKPTLQSIRHPMLDELGITISILRLDLIHPQVNGNKWFKLKLNLEEILQTETEQVLSFGGAWSNHLLAVAAAGCLCGFRTFGVIRGEQIDPPTPVLQRLRKLGMSLIPVSRDRYRCKAEPEFLEKLQQQIGDFYCLPEGGTNNLAIQGCMEIAEHFEWQNDSTKKLVVGACGTGGMLSGVILGLEAQKHKNRHADVLGISVLKAPDYLPGEIRSWLNRFNSTSSVKWRVAEDYHCGGYAKTSRDLGEFLECFQVTFPVPVEPVYTGKMAYGLWQEIQSGRVAPGSEIIAIHSGGLFS